MWMIKELGSSASSSVPSCFILTQIFWLFLFFAFFLRRSFIHFFLFDILLGRPFVQSSVCFTFFFVVLSPRKKKSEYVFDFLILSRETRNSIFFEGNRKRARQYTLRYGGGWKRQEWRGKRGKEICLASFLLVSSTFIPFLRWSVSAFVWWG